MKTEDYCPLGSGDIRQAGDEVRARKGYWGSTWQSVKLIGKNILPSDLIHAEFRRLRRPTK